MTYQIDLNCDLGESFGSYKIGCDEEILPYISSANIACGFHAGDPNVMRKTVQLALKHHVSIGAHPGFQDLIGFGRRNMKITSDEAYNLVVYQIGALQAFVQAEGGVLKHVKPHGALYNMAANDRILADAIAEAVYQVNPELILYGLANSELIKAGHCLGLRTAQEVFADRTYQADGTLTPRTNPNAILSSDAEAITQVLSFIKDRSICSTDGKRITVQADTICLHGDNEQALHFAKTIASVLKEENIKVQSLN